MQNLTLSLFEPHVGSSFQIMLNGEPALELKLAELEDLTVKERQRDPSITASPFSMIFHGPLTPIAPQSIYDLSHAQLGQLQIFLVPIGPDKQTRQNMQYQAIFN